MKRNSCEALLDRGTKVCSGDKGHMTRMATTPVYGKKPSKIFFSRTSELIAMDLVCSIRDSGHGILFKL